MRSTLILITLFFVFNSCLQEIENATKINTDTNTTKVLYQKLENAGVFKFSVSKLINNETDIKNKLIGKINIENNDDVVLIPKRYSYKETYLKKEVYNAFLRMAHQAKKEGLRLIVLSGIRTFDQQKELWEKKWMQILVTERDELKITEEILKYIAMPMTSRHHWGTEIDINMVEKEYFEKGEGLRVYKWLKKNAPKFGFHQVYTSKAKSNRKGYEMEEWHWSYMPLAKEYLNQYNTHIKHTDFKGFLGAQFAKDLKIIDEYVNGIDSKE